MFNLTCGLIPTSQAHCHHSGIANADSLLINTQPFIKFANFMYG